MIAKLFRQLKSICDADSSLSHDRVLFETKKSLLHQIILLTIAIGTVLMIIAFIESFFLGFDLLPHVYLLLYIPLIIIGKFYRKLSYKYSVLILLINVYILGLINLLIYSINGAAIPIFMILLVLATIFLGLKSGLHFLILCVLSMIIIAFFYINGILSLRITLSDISKSGISWLTAISVLISLGIINMFCYSLIQTKMLKSHETSMLQAKELQKLNDIAKKDLKILNIAEQKLRESNQNYQDVVENISTVIWKADLTKNNEMVNVYLSDVANTMLNLPGGTIGNNWKRFVSFAKPEFKEPLERAILQVIDSPGELDLFEYEVTKANKESAWLQLKMKCFTHDGKLSLFGTISDITKRKIAEKELLVYKKNLENIVVERTSELEHQKKELIKLNKVFVGREHRIKELREELKELKYKISQPSD